MQCLQETGGKQVDSTVTYPTFEDIKKLAVEMRGFVDEKG